MNRGQRERLEHAGWKVGEVSDFLALSQEESLFIELKLALASAVRQRRETRGLTQEALAERLGSSQSRVAKIEAADKSVSLDLIVRSLLYLGATGAEIAKLVRQAENRNAA